MINEIEDEEGEEEVTKHENEVGGSFYLVMAVSML